MSAWFCGQSGSSSGPMRQDYLLIVRVIIWSGALVTGYKKTVAVYSSDTVCGGDNVLLTFKVCLSVYP